MTNRTTIGYGAMKTFDENLNDIFKTIAKKIRKIIRTVI